MLRVSLNVSASRESIGVVSTISDVDRVAAIEQAYPDGYWRFLSLALGMLDVDRARDAVQEAFAHALRHEAIYGSPRASTPGSGGSCDVCRVEKRHPVRAGRQLQLEAPAVPATGWKYQP